MSAFRLFVFFLLIIVGSLGITQRVLAQVPTSSPSANVQAQGNLLNDLLNLIFGKLDNNLKASMPQDAYNSIKDAPNPTISPGQNVQGLSISIGNQAAGRYALEQGINTPNPASTDLASWFSNLLSTIGISGAGDQAAANYGQSKLPVPSGILNMTNAEPKIECAGLPPSAGTQSNCTIALNAPNVTPSATITPGGPTLTPGPTSIQPTISPHNCPLGTGFCSVAYLSTPNSTTGFPGFGPTSVENASKICNVESNGGHTDALNADCLIGKSADYSVGLFQYNLLPASRCPGAFSSYTVNPPSCTVGDQNVLNSCVVKYEDPDVNIKTAYDLSGGGVNWKDWGAAYYCGIETK